MNDLYSAISGMGNSRFGRLQDTVNMINKTATANGFSFSEAASEIYNLVREDAPEDLATLDEDDHRDRLDSEGDVWKYSDAVNPRGEGHWTLLRDGLGNRNLKDINGEYGPLKVINL